ncbi:Protein of unknown function [Gryllus bimaculatus]|nr:Protein of unknown function [Gryllus bimaculatus]
MFPSPPHSHGRSSARRRWCWAGPAASASAQRRSCCARGPIPSRQLEGFPIRVSTTSGAAPQLGEALSSRLVSRREW